ncbi:MAG: hypothetical protein V4550_14465 [Gemmatimonadota bacterium]
MRWRHLLSPPSDGPTNMAIDCALMERARRTGESVLRIYSWSAPVLSLGRNQRACGLYDDLALERHGVHVVRRPTGGRALLHHREITYSVTAPVTDSVGLTATYREVNALLCEGLRAIGVAAEVAPAGPRARVPDATPCFAEPSAGELVVGGRKLVGSAQFREGSALLQHGSVIVDDDQGLIPHLMRSPAPIPPVPATLNGLLGRSVDPKELSDALFANVRMMDASVSSLSRGEIDDLQIDNFLQHFRDAGWTWRR